MNYRMLKRVMLVGLVVVITAFGIARTAPAALIEAGDDQFPSVGRVRLVIDTITLFTPVTFTETISLDSRGTLATVHRDQENDQGTASQDDDTIDTEIIALDLWGTVASLGDQDVRLRVGDRKDDFLGHPDRPGKPVFAGASTGKITAVYNTGTDPSSFVSGESFFDVFFEIDFPDPTHQVTFYNKDPLRIDAGTIYAIPPIFSPYAFTHDVDIYAKPFCTDNDPDPSVNPRVGLVAAASGCHTPTPEPSSLIVWGLLGAVCITAGWWGRRKRAA